MASGIMRKAMVFLGLDDEELDEYDAYEPEVASPPQTSRRYPSEPAEAPAPQPLGIRPMPRDSFGDPSGSMSVSPRSVVRPITAVQSAKVHVVAPVHFADAQEIADRIKSGQPVIVNLQAGDPGLSRRMIDFCSGVTYALGGAMEKAADQVFLLTPSNVEVSAEEKRRLKDKGLYRS